MIKIGIIGFGYWGPNLARNFSQIDSCLIKAIADTNEERLMLAKKLYPDIEMTSSAMNIINDPDIDCIVIATPVSSHHDLGKRALLKDKNVLIEKPMTHSQSQALELIDLAIKKKKLLMVDHTFLYTGAVRKIKEIISENQIGEVTYFDSIRINLGLFQHDINIIWDLVPHDVSIFQYLIDEFPTSVIATGISHTENKIENITYITLYFQSNLIAHFTSSWVSPVKIRKILIGGTKKMIIYNDVEPTEKVKVYDTGFKILSKEDEHKLLVDYRIGDIYIPKIDTREALWIMANDFINAVTKGTEPVSNWKTGLEVVKILEASDISLRNHGKEMMIR